MKRIVGVILVLAMLMTLFACTKEGGGGETTSPATSPASTGSDASQTPTDTASQTPADSGNNDVEDAINSTIGYVTDELDYWGRDEYKIVYYNYRPSNVTFQVTEAFEKLGLLYNFTIEQLTANGDSDAYVTNLQTILLKEPDGLIVDITQELAPRVSEILAEYDTPAICIFNKPVDVNNVALIPSVIMDQFYNGRRQVEYLDEVYKDYWGDIDRSKIALLRMDWSQNMDINARAVGALEKFNELFPGNKEIYGDTAADSLSAEAGFNVANSILSANPDVEYWFIVSSVEDVALGTGRAVEALGLTDKVLMTSSGAAILPGEWAEGYDGIWIANYSVPPMLYAGTSLFGLFALIDGRATNETLWPEHLLPGDKAARFMAGADMMSLTNFEEYISSIDRTFGIED